MFDYAENFNHEGKAKIIMDGKRIIIDTLGNEVGTWTEIVEHDYSYHEDSPNYEEETWWSLTDGQYGDYPGGDIDYDFLGL